MPKISDQPEVSSSIPSIYSRPIKFLGRMIDSSISDRNFSAELIDKLLAGLSVIDKSHFTRTQKLSILQHLLIPNIQRSLLIYEIPIPLVFKLEQKVYIFIGKRLHLHHSTSSLYFCSSVPPCSLPIKSLSPALKASKISGHLLLRSSQDFFSGYVRKVETGTWKVEDTVLSCKNETAIITGMGLNTPPHQKSLVKNLQNIIRDVFQTPTNQLMTAKPSPKLYNCSFKVDGYTLLSMTFLGPL